MDTKELKINELGDQIDGLQEQINKLIKLRNGLRNEVKVEKINAIIEENASIKNFVTKQFGPDKALNIPVVISGNDHDNGYCSGNDGEELEEEVGFVIAGTHALVSMRLGTYEDFADDKFDVDGVWTGDASDLHWRLKQCSSLSGSGYCGCYLNYDACGKVRWLKGYDIDELNKNNCGVLFPSGLKHVYKKYDN
jgi:hypothetical protein